MLNFLLLTSLPALVLAELELQPRYLEDSLERIEGGEVARPNSWPWQVSIQARVSNFALHTCGGTLIGRDWVMTAARCVRSNLTLVVVLGEHDLRSPSGREQIIDVSEIHIHPQWDTCSLCDIALLRLSTEATLNSYVQVASLPPSGQILPHNNLCYMTGWGRIFNTGSKSLPLKQAYLSVIDHKTCTGNEWPCNTISDIVVCAGGGGVYPDSEDYGGPLNCLVNGKYYVHGITSFVSLFHCHDPQKPTIFTRVSAHIEWINSIVMV